MALHLHVGKGEKAKPKVRKSGKKKTKEDLAKAKKLGEAKKKAAAKKKVKPKKK